MDNQVRYTVSAQDLLSPQLRTMDSNARALESTMGNLGTAIVSAFSIYAVTNFANKVLDAGTTVENALTGLTTLLGSSAEATNVVKNTMEDASATPFAFEGLLSANKALIGAGVEAGRARTDVLNLANAIAATGGGDNELQRMVVNMQQISNTGKATAMDIKQFAFAGINIYKVLADATGQPISKVKEMEVSYDLLTIALQKAHEKGGIYYNGLENMAGNTSVKISAVGDAVFQLFNNIFVATKPLIDSLIDASMGFIGVAQGLLDWTNNNAAAATALGAAIGTVVTATILFVTWQKAVALWTGFAATSALYYEVALAGMIAAEAGASAGGIVLAGVMALLNAVNPFVWMVLGAAAVVAGLTYLYMKFGAIRGVMQAAWNVIKAYVGIWADGFKALGDIVIGVFTLDLDQISKGFDDMTDLVISSGKRIKDAAESGYESGQKSFRHDKYLESATSVIDKINAEVDKNTDKSIQHALNLTASIKRDLAKQVSSGYITDKEQSDLLGKLRAPVKKGPGIQGMPGTPGKDNTKGVSGPKVVTINVKINNLINDFSIKTVSVNESPEAIKKMVIQALTSAVNDSQIVAGEG